MVRQHVEELIALFKIQKFFFIKYILKPLN